jgi:hypothetical protein
VFRKQWLSLVDLFVLLLLADWHRERTRLLDLFEFHPAVRQYSSTFYEHVFSTNLETVSVHLRLGYKGEPSLDLLAGRAQPTLDWFSRVMRSQFAPASSLFLIFSDNVELASNAMLPLRKVGLHIVIMHENSVTTLELMSRCKHHILTSSTLSFWGAYLDR